MGRIRLAVEEVRLRHPVKRRSESIANRQACSSEGTDGREFGVQPDVAIGLIAAEDVESCFLDRALGRSLGLGTTVLGVMVWVAAL